jgi:hypothetical protein
MLACFEMPTIASAGDAEIAIGACLAAVASGKISAEDAEKIVAIIKAMGETVHMRLVEERLAALEAAGKPQQIIQRGHRYLRYGPTPGPTE